MIGLDILGADAPASDKKDKGSKSTLTSSAWVGKLKEHATYVGAGLGIVVGALAMAFTGKHTGSRWTGRAPLPFGKKPMKAMVKNGVGATVLGVAGAGAGHYLKEKEGW
jgi:hypothetical protein